MTEVALKLSDFGAKNDSNCTYLSHLHWLFFFFFNLSIFILIITSRTRRSCVFFFFFSIKVSKKIAGPRFNFPSFFLPRSCVSECNNAAKEKKIEKENVFALAMMEGNGVAPRGLSSSKAKLEREKQWGDWLPCQDHWSDYTHRVNFQSSLEEEEKKKSIRNNQAFR